MPTTTPNLGLTLPTPNVDTGWGSTLNTDFTLIDDLFAASGAGPSVGLNVGSGKTISVGGTLIGAGTIIFGSGDGTGTVNAPTIRGAARTGSNAMGANITIDAANGTGTGGSGRFIFRTAPAGSTGSVANTMRTVLELGNDGIVSAPLGLSVSGVDVTTLTPTGSVLAFAGSSAPAGWMLCDGQPISRTTYSALFAVIGTTYGVGDGASTFNLPDLRGRAIAGKDNMGGTPANRLTSTRSVTVSTISQSGSTVTVVTSSAHGLDAGNTVVISGAGNPVFDGTWTVSAVVITGSEATRASRSFQFSRTSATISSVAGGTVTTTVSGSVDGSGLGNSGGVSTVTLTNGSIPNHTHYLPVAGVNSTWGVIYDFNASDVSFSGSGTDKAANSWTGGGGPHNNVQPTIVLNYIIKA